MKWLIRVLAIGFTLVFISACNAAASVPATSTATATQVPPTATPLPAFSELSISLGQETTGQLISLDAGADADTQLASVGGQATAARQTGNGQALNASDGNTTPDSYMQFNVDDAVMFEGNPTSSVRLDIEYFDQGTDSFIVQYDAVRGGPNGYGDGTFLETRPVYKTNSLQYKTVSFVLKDIYFGNRDNGADFRISDKNDGAEIIRRVTITLLPVPNIINVDSCGANPYDDQPDSNAIQECIGQARIGDTVTFTSGERLPGYRGYLINKTIFLETNAYWNYLTFTSTDPQNPALLMATSDLKGFVVQLFARSRLPNPGAIDYITISHLHLDGNRDERVCMGADGVANGRGDNWGSWLNECTTLGDSWCLPGTLSLAGSLDWDDPSQNYALHPDKWSTGFLVEDMHITNTECGTAFGMSGADNVIMDTTIETAGDHVHIASCAQTDPDNEGIGDWSDGITFVGPDHLILNNTVINASDVGIVFFGGRGTIIRGNTIRATTGNYGTFAGIAIHPWSLGDVSFGQIVGNTVVSEANQTCGGIHAGINIGPHMWGGACLNNVVTPDIGNPSCTLDPAPPQGSLCPSSGACQVWASIAQPDATYLLADNNVTGAHINYLVEGLDQVGALIDSQNVSNTPRWSDWGASRTGCNGVYWGPTDKIAHHPSLPGWTDKLIHCER